jgi:hypothetical protein
MGIMRLLEGPNFYRLDVLAVLAFTIMAIVQGEVSVFYIVYLFWFQELIRTIIDNVYISTWKRDGMLGDLNIEGRFGGLFLLFIYFIFIVVLFGVVFNWNDRDLLFQNIRVLLYRNWFFNLNLVAFALEYWFYRKSQHTRNMRLGAFNQNHIILHISIILGGVIQGLLLPKLGWTGNYGMLIVIAPFLLMKGLLDYRLYKREVKAISRS